MQFDSYKQSMKVAFKILFIQCVLVWLFPFVSPPLAWFYGFFVVASYMMIVQWSRDEYYD